MSNIKTDVWENTAEDVAVVRPPGSPHTFWYVLVPGAQEDAYSRFDNYNTIIVFSHPRPPSPGVRPPHPPADSIVGGAGGFIYICIHIIYIYIHHMYIYI